MDERGEQQRGEMSTITFWNALSTNYHTVLVGNPSFESTITDTTYLFALKILFLPTAAEEFNQFIVY